MTRRKELGIGTHAWGEASVMAVALKLTWLGYRVFKPVVDDHGVDLAVLGENGKAARIQVKSASLGTRYKYGVESSPQYAFELGKVKANYAEGLKTESRVFSNEVEFVILHGVEDDRYWIVPAEILDNKKSVAISTAARDFGSPERFGNILRSKENAWDEIATYLERAAG